MLLIDDDPYSGKAMIHKSHSLFINRRISLEDDPRPGTAESR